MNHLPPYIKKYDEFKAKGVDVVAVLAANDPFVMSGWARVEGLKDKVNYLFILYMHNLHPSPSIKRAQKNQIYAPQNNSPA